MSMVIVLDDDLRAFNCFREQMVAMIHGVFNNSLFAKIIYIHHSPFLILANLAGPISLTRKLNLSHIIKVGEIQMLAKPIYVLWGRKIFGQPHWMYFYAENMNLVAESQTMPRNLKIKLSLRTTQDGEIVFLVFLSTREGE
ncbi:hypothetical protein Peur_030283 [Populus x canadensis]